MSSIAGSLRHNSSIFGKESKEAKSSRSSLDAKDTSEPEEKKSFFKLSNASHSTHNFASKLRHPSIVKEGVAGGAHLLGSSAHLLGSGVAGSAQLLGNSVSGGAQLLGSAAGLTPFSSHRSTESEVSLPQYPKEPEVEKKPVPRPVRKLVLMNPATVKILRKVWECAHLGVVASSLVFTFFYIIFLGGSLCGQIAYRLIFIFSTAAYGLSLNQRFQGQRPSFFVLLRMDSFQYGALGFFWLFTTWHFIKIVPFIYFSAMHASDFIAAQLKTDSTLRTNLNRFQRVDGPRLLKLINYNNLLVLGRLILDVITFRNGSMLSLLVFLFYYRIRIAYSPATLEVLQEVRAKIDELSENPKVPAKVKEAWSNLKQLMDSRDHAVLDPKTAREKAAKVKEIRAKEAEEARIAKEQYAKQKQKPMF